MATITHDITLSTTEPNNNIGLLKVRHADDNTQVLNVSIIENGLPKIFTGLTPFFCLMAQEVTGQGVSEEPIKTFNSSAGTLSYTMSANALQFIGKNEAYFSFRSETASGTWVEQFSTHSFVYVVEKSIYSQPFKDSNYWWTFKELYRQFLEYQVSGKKSWEGFVEQNREIIESVDPGGKLLAELIDARNGYSSLNERLEKSDLNVELLNKLTDVSIPLNEKIAVHAWDGRTFDGQYFDDLVDYLKRAKITKWRFGVSWATKYGNANGVNYTYDYEKNVIAKLKENGITPVVYVQGGAPSNITNYADKVSGAKDFVVKTVRALSNLGVIWESWNEPNIGFWFDWSNSSAVVQDWVDVAILMGKTIRQYDSNAIYLVGAFSISTNYLTGKDESSNWEIKVDSAISKGILRYADAISIHPYNLVDRPEEFLYTEISISKVKSMLKKYGVSEVPIVVSEFGYSTLNDSSINPISDETRAKWLTRALIIFDYLKMPLITIFNAATTYTAGDNESGFGIFYVDGNGLSSTSTANSLSRLLVDLDGYRLIRRLNKFGKSYYYFEYRNKLDKTKLVFWHDEDVDDIIEMVDNQEITITEEVQSITINNIENLNVLSTKNSDFLDINHSKNITKRLPASSNLNNVETGEYILAENDYTNAPDSNGWGMLDSKFVTGIDRTDAVQFVYHTWKLFNQIRMRTRHNTNGTWTNWKALETIELTNPTTTTTTLAGGSGSVIVKLYKHGTYQLVDVQVTVSKLSTSRGNQTIVDIPIANLPTPRNNTPVFFDICNIIDFSKNRKVAISPFTTALTRVQTNYVSSNVTDTDVLTGGVSYIAEL